PLIDADASFDQRDYPAALLTPFRMNGALHGVPFEITFRLLRYNPALFDAAGLGYPQPTWTLDDLLQTAQALTSGSDNNRQYGLVAPDVRHITYVLDQFGASPTLGSGKDIRPNFTDPTVVRALRYYLELLRAASPHTKLNNCRYLPEGRGSDWEALNSVWQGRAAMWLDGGELLNYLPMGTNQPPVVGAIAPPPLGQRPLTPNDFTSSGLYISARTQHPEACWQWLTFLSGQPEALDRETFPARRSVAESEAFRARMAPGAAEVYRAYTPLLNNEALPAQPTQRLNAYGPELDGFWFYQAVERALQGADLEQELADAQFKTEQFIACYRGGEGWRVCARQVDPQYQGFALMFEKE
ncbi:MAG: extracellular solute-binding protein, partial [Chloroflexaceae bacterium]|nr:extracellular solute-binding protein [Chloroflexaceae bacterium]